MLILKILTTSRLFLLVLLRATPTAPSFRVQIATSSFRADLLLCAIAVHPIVLFFLCAVISAENLLVLAFPFAAQFFLLAVFFAWADRSPEDIENRFQFLLDIVKFFALAERIPFHSFSFIKREKAVVSCNNMLSRMHAYKLLNNSNLFRSVHLNTQQV